MITEEELKNAHKLSQKRYCEAHPDRVKEAQEKFNRLHPESSKERNLKWREAHREQERQRARENYQKRKEMLAKLREEANNGRESL